MPEPEQDSVDSITLIEENEAEAPEDPTEKIQDVPSTNQVPKVEQSPVASESSTINLARD